MLILKALAWPESLAVSSNGYCIGAGGFMFENQRAAVDSRVQTLRLSGWLERTGTKTSDSSVALDRQTTDFHQARLPRRIPSMHSTLLEPPIGCVKPRGERNFVRCEKTTLLAQRQGFTPARNPRRSCNPHTLGRFLASQHGSGLSSATMPGQLDALRMRIVRQCPGMFERQWWESLSGFAG